MNVPTGYTVLDFVGFTDKGRYDATETYVKNDIVYFGGSSWKCKVDDTTGIEPAEGDYWTVFAEGESGSIVNDSAPYTSRIGRDGLAKMELVGGTVVWNQLVQNGNFADTSNWTAIGANLSVDGNVATIVASSDWGRIRSNLINIVNEHKYILFGQIKATTSVIRILIADADTNNPVYQYVTSSTDWVDVSIIFAANVAGIKCAHIGASPTPSTFYAKGIQLIDLTQMFGTTIADYVYSLEQSVVGSGIAWLRSYGFFTKDYYEYDAGSLQSVCTSARKIIDLNGNERTYPIDDVQLRGLFKLDTNNKLYCDGDIYKSSGNVTRKYGIVDLGSLNWNYVTTVQTPCFASLASVFNGKLRSVNIICPLYTPKVEFYDSQGNDMCMYIANTSINISNSSYTDAATFKTAMSGVYLVYELATPTTETTETADPYINPQRSIANGTEEFVDGLTRDVMVPVGNNSQYTVSMLLPIVCEYIDAVASASATTE